MNRFRGIFNLVIVCRDDLKVIDRLTYEFCQDQASRGIAYCEVTKIWGLTNTKTGDHYWLIFRLGFPLCSWSPGRQRWPPNTSPRRSWRPFRGVKRISGLRSEKVQLQNVLAIINLRVFFEGSAYPLLHPWPWRPERQPRDCQTLPTVLRPRRRSGRHRRGRGWSYQRRCIWRWWI